MSKSTVVKYQIELGLEDIQCECGKPLRHRGWCKVRYGRSPVRQKFWADWHEQRRCDNLGKLT